MTKRVLLLLADGFEPLEAAGFTDVLRSANIDGDEPIELVSADLRSPLKATFGFSVLPGALVADRNLYSLNALAVPGGFGNAGSYKNALSEPFLAVIRHFAGRQQPVASACVASVALGAAGVLAGRVTTTYHQKGGKRRAQLEAYGAPFVDQALVIDNNLINSTGPGIAIEAAFALLIDLTSEKTSEQIRAPMRVPRPASSWWSSPQVQTA